MPGESVVVCCPTGRGVEDVVILPVDFHGEQPFQAVEGRFARNVVRPHLGDRTKLACPERMSRKVSRDALQQCLRDRCHDGSRRIEKEFIGCAKRFCESHVLPVSVRRFADVEMDDLPAGSVLLQEGDDPGVPCRWRVLEPGHRVLEIFRGAGSGAEFDGLSVRLNGISHQERPTIGDAKCAYFEIDWLSEFPLSRATNKIEDLLAERRIDPGCRMVGILTSTDGVEGDGISGGQVSIQHPARLPLIRRPAPALSPCGGNAVSGLQQCPVRNLEQPLALAGAWFAAQRKETIDGSVHDPGFLWLGMDMCPDGIVGCDRPLCDGGVSGIA